MLSLMNVPDLAARSRLLHDAPAGERDLDLHVERQGGARRSRSQAPPAMVGVNIGVAAPMSFFPFGGRRRASSAT